VDLGALGHNFPGGPFENFKLLMANFLTVFAAKAKIFAFLTASGINFNDFNC
jgi:hypothetical protein